MTTLAMPTATPVHLDSIFDNADHFEIIDGVKLELPPTGVEAAGIAAILNKALIVYDLTRNVGMPFVEMLFRLPLPVDRNRRPDLAFVPYARFPANRAFPKKTTAWDMLPDVIVEVVSPSDLAEETRDKLSEYLQSGVPLIWMIYPDVQVVDAYEGGKLTIRTRNDELEGGLVLPEFRLPLRELFR